MILKGIFGYRWWPERESNPRHEDFQWRVAKLSFYFQQFKFKNSSVLQNVLRRYARFGPSYRVFSMKTRYDSRAEFVKKLAQQKLAA